MIGLDLVFGLADRGSEHRSPCVWLEATGEEPEILLVVSVWQAGVRRSGRDRHRVVPVYGGELSE